MATHVTTVLIDDIDGGQADETLHLTFEGERYTIDLSSKNAAKLRKVIQPYLDAGRREGAVKRATESSRDSTHVSKIRAWAIDQGFSVAERGRLRAEIFASYRASH